MIHGNIRMGQACDLGYLNLPCKGCDPINIQISTTVWYYRYYDPRVSASKGEIMANASLYFDLDQDLQVR